MIPIKELVNSVISSKTEKIQKTPKNYAIAIDISGSTSCSFGQHGSILKKEVEIVKNFILNNIHNTYNLCSFDSVCEPHDIHVDRYNKKVIMPNLVSKGGTSTHLALSTINTKLKTIPDVVLIVTDGQTGSRKEELMKEVEIFAKRNVKLEIIAVSENYTNLNEINANEERYLPGMDLINYLKNSIDKLSIYNLFHIDNPYVGAVSSAIGKKNLSFMGLNFEGFIPSFLDKVMDKLKENKGKIDWGNNFNQFLSEIGKLLSVLFNEYQEDNNNFYLQKIIKCVKDNCCVDDITCENINDIIKYGYECAKEQTPIIYTNFEKRVKEQIVKFAEFRNAIVTLNSKGTTLGSHKSISMPNNGVCAIVMERCLNLTQPLNTYPNSQDNLGNTYFGCDSDPQAIRIAMREFCETQGFHDAKKSSCVIFYVLNQMSLLFINGMDLNSEYMREMRKLAIAQTSMENMIEHKIYSGVGFYEQWKSGKSVPMHYSDPRLHSSLYTAHIINPLKLAEPFWWALMMSMLGIFNEQLYVYYKELDDLGIASEYEFLKFIKSDFSQKIKGDISSIKLTPKPKSIFTLDFFTKNDEVYVLKQHNECCTNTHYSLEEINSYISQNGCVWCHYKPTMEDFEKVDLTKSRNDLIREKQENATKLIVINMHKLESKMQSQNFRTQNYNNNHKNNQPQKLPTDADFPSLPTFSEIKAENNNNQKLSFLEIILQKKE